MVPLGQVRPGREGLLWGRSPQKQRLRPMFPRDRSGYVLSQVLSWEGGRSSHLGTLSWLSSSFGGGYVATESWSGTEEHWLVCCIKRVHRGSMPGVGCDQISAWNTWPKPPAHLLAWAPALPTVASCSAR